MYYRIYLDTLFFVNFFMDYCILTLVSKVLRLTTTHLLLRRILGSMLGAVWLCVVVAFKIHNLPCDLLSYAGVPAIMCLVLMGKNNIRTYLKGLVLIYIMAAVLGGILHMLYYYTIAGYLLQSATLEMWLLIGGTALCMPAISRVFTHIRRKNVLSETEKTVIFENSMNKVQVKALVDTGNSLSDPFFGGTPVSIAEYDVIKNAISQEEKSTYHLIPFNSLGNENGIIPVVRLKRLTIIEEKGSIHIEKPLVALYTGRLSGRGEYRMILHPEVIREINNRQGVEENVFKSDDAKKVSVSDDAEL